MKSLKLIAIFLSVLCFVGSSSGQTDTTQGLDMEGKLALSFQLGGYLQISSFDGSLLSIKKMINNESAWRMGIGLSGSHTEGEEIRYSDYSVQENDDSRLSVYLTLSKQNYFNNNEKFRGYYGIGGRTDYQHAWGTDVEGYSRETIKFGPSGYLGVEWLVNRQISLTCEYGAYLYFSYSQYKIYVVSLSREVVTRNRMIGFSNDGVKVGVSVYF
ncbi:MAG: hypothetical protein HY960_00535 [Ignavibacteriae bacterium]|nr:hypothetical protein [Ignavibacteriota bacterium]